jgi:succinylglutamate desuccinylase
MTDDAPLELHGLPDGLLDVPAARLHEHLDDLTLIHLDGERSPALFVSVLLHGNEHGGWDAVRELLARRLAAGPLPRALTLLVGNVGAARLGVRRHDDAPDLNRIWTGAEGPEAGRAARVLARMRERGLFCTVDVHNNTGVNPHYACITRDEASSIALGARFSRPVILVRKPDTVLAAAFAEQAPAVILEAGRPGERRGVEHVAAFLDGLLDLEALPPAPESPVDLYRTVATVTLAPEVEFGFTVPHGERAAADLHLLHEFEHFNFEELDAGTLFGHVPEGAPLPLRVTDDRGADVADAFLRREGDELRFARRVVPAMFSPDPRILRQDVVCYLMERLG